MELAIDDPIKRAQQYAVNPNNFQGGQAPLSSNPGLGSEMTNMVKQRAMNGALNKGQGMLTEGIASAAGPSAGAANTAALAANPATMGMGGAEVALAGQAMGGAGAGAGMAALGTAMPYVGAGLLAGKAFGLFNEGGQVGPLNAQYHAEGTGAMKTPEMEKLLEGLSFEELYKQEYGDASIENWMKQHNYKSQGGPISPQYNAQGTMTEEQARALMNNQPEPMPQPPRRRPVAEELFDEIKAEQNYVSSESLSPPGFSEEMARYMQAIGQPFGGRQ